MFFIKYGSLTALTVRDSSVAANQQKLLAHFICETETNWSGKSDNTPSTCPCPSHLSYRFGFFEITVASSLRFFQYHFLIKKLILDNIFFNSLLYLMLGKIQEATSVSKGYVVSLLLHIKEIPGDESTTSFSLMKFY